MSARSWASGPGNISWRIEFKPMTFLTSVSTADKTITVTPFETEIELPNSNIVDVTLSDADLMSRMTSSSLAFPVLYQVLSTNEQAVLSLPGNEVNLLVPSDISSAWVQPVASATEALLDDLLMYQGVLAVSRNDGESTSQPIVRYFVAIKIGDAKYQIAQLVITLVLCVVYIYEAVRARYWKHLSEFDFVHVKALMLATLGPEDTGVRRGGSRKTRFHATDREDNLQLVAEYTDSKPRIRYVTPPARNHQAAYSVDEHIAPQISGSASSTTPSVRSRDGDHGSHGNGDDISTTILRPLLSEP